MTAKAQRIVKTWTIWGGLILTIGGSALGVATSWGAMQTTVAEHSKRIDRIAETQKTNRKAIEDKAELQHRELMDAIQRVGDRQIDMDQRLSRIEGRFQK